MSVLMPTLKHLKSYDPCFHESNLHQKHKKKKIINKKDKENY